VAIADRYIISPPPRLLHRRRSACAEHYVASRMRVVPTVFCARAVSLLLGATVNTGRFVVGTPRHGCHRPIGVLAADMSLLCCTSRRKRSTGKRVRFCRGEPICHYILRVFYSLPSSSSGLSDRVVSASDCGMRGPRFTRAGAIYSLGHRLRTCTVLCRSTQPSTIRGTVK